MRSEERATVSSAQINTDNTDKIVSGIEPNNTGISKISHLQQIWKKGTGTVSAVKIKEHQE